MTRLSESWLTRINMFWLLGILSLLASAQSGVLAESASSSPTTSSSLTSSATTTSSTGITTHSVAAGQNAAFVFNPDTITANVGDIIEFAFYPLNHSVARSAYLTPCLPIKDSTPSFGDGFWSGFFPLATGTEEVPKYKVRVNDTAPIWFYCSAPGACIDDGMVGVVNPNSTQTLDVQMAYAKNSTIMLSPGEPVPAEGTTPSSTASTTSTSSSSGLSKGAIAGIAVGIVAFLAVAGLAVFLLGRNHTLASILRYSQPPPQRRANIPPLPYSPPPLPSPYSPEFEPKVGQIPSPEMSQHNSWQPAGYPPRAMSPENQSQAGDAHEGQGLMKPNSFYNQYHPPHPQYDDPHNAYPENRNPVRIQSSPGETPWSPGAFGLTTQYAHAPPSEMGGEGVSPGRLSPGFASSTHGSHAGQEPLQAEQGPHELDARSSVPETPHSPPGYQPNNSTTHRTFSFNEGGEAPPGVEKVLRE